MSEPAKIIDLLAAARTGHADAWEIPPTVVSDELRRLAAIRIRSEHRPHTVQPKALVEEAYLRLMGGRRPNWHTAADFGV